MSNGDISEITIRYEVNKKKEFEERDDENIIIFGSEFVKNNKKECK